MSLARCPVVDCQRVLDVPEILASWRCPNGRCAQCNNVFTKEEYLAMDFPKDVLEKIAQTPKAGPMDQCAITQPKRRYVFRAKPEKIESNVALPDKASKKPTIERGIPIPKPPKPKRESKYPFKKLKPPRSKSDMDSFLVPFDDTSKAGKDALAKAVSSASYAYRVTHDKNAKFTVRTMLDGVRCWRVK